MEPLTELLPIGTRVAVCPDVHGYTVLGTIVAVCPFTYEPSNANAGRIDLAYAVALDRGAYLERDDLAPGARPWISHILAHVDNVEAVNPFSARGAVPDPGGYQLLALMDDGGTLCERCATDPANPVHDERNAAGPASTDGWGLVAFYTSGDVDTEGATCDHCGRIIVEPAEDAS